MKILQINTVCGVGSTGRIATDLADFLRKEGHSCKIAFGRDEARGIPEEDAIKIGSKYSVYGHAFLTRLTDRTAFYSKQGTKKLLADMEAYQPDVVHLHNLHGYYLNIELLFQYLAKMKIPVVWTLHDCWSFTGHCSYFDFVGCEKWKTECHACPNKKTYPSSFFLDQSRSNFKRKKDLFTSVENMTIITPSHWLGDLTRASFLGDYPVKVIHNGIDLEQFRPRASNFREKHQLQDKKIVLGVASIWGERKGFHDFIKLNDLLEEAYQIVLVGLNEKQRNTLPPSMIGIMKTNNVEELAEIYTAADVFVNPTYEDNFPTTNIESLACGTPVITYETGGSPECLDESCGRVVKKGDVQGLKHRIMELCESTMVMEGSCYKRSLLFDKKERYGEYLEVYCNING